MDRLSDNVIGEILDRLEISDESRDYQYDGGVVSTIDVYPLLDRQISETLKAVGEWMNKNFDIKTWEKYEEFIIKLSLKGEMP